MGELEIGIQGSGVENCPGAFEIVEQEVGVALEVVPGAQDTTSVPRASAASFCFSMRHIAFMNRESWRTSDAS